MKNLGGGIVAVIVLAALLAGPLAPFDPDAIDILHRFAPPGGLHWLGTDQLGRDLFSRLLYGARVAMSISATAILLALALGACLGILAGWLGGWWERIILILFDIVAAFPSLILALAAVAVFGPSNAYLVGIITLTLAPQFGRVARAQTLGLMQAPFIEAERILGAGSARIMAYHVLPNIAGPLAVLAAMEIPTAITIEAGLSFLGLGIRPPLASWGTLIYDGYAYLSDSTWPVLVSSLALALATLGFTLSGEALRDWADPRTSQ